MKPRSLTRAAAPKPCPRCYAPMAKTANGYACARHGAPELPRALPPRAARALLAGRAAQRGRLTSAIVYCNDHVAKIIASPLGLYCSVCDKRLPPIFAAGIPPSASA